MKVPLLDLTAQYQSLKAEILPVVEEVLESQRFILGPKVDALEEAVAEYCGTRGAVGVSSGSDALIISLMAAGVGVGDRVITTPYTFFATAGAIVRVGARPVFVDIDPETYNLDPAAVSATLDAMDDTARQRVRAIVPVHLYGQCADMDPILDIAAQYQLVVIEDAAQAIGAAYRGRRAGSMGEFGCFSFFPSKNLGAFGDGGMVTANAPDRVETLKILRGHGADPKYVHHRIGGNFRLDALQAAVLSVKLRYLDAWTAGRQENADTYRRLFADAGLDAAQLPVAREERHIYNQFVIRVPERRDALRQFLLESEIGTEVYYPIPLHLQECFSGLNHRKGDFPVAEAAADQTLALPVYPELTQDQMAWVVERIRQFYA